MKKPKVNQLDKCRICGGYNVQKFLHLPDMPFTDDFTSVEQFGQEFKADIDVFICNHCMVVQTQHDVDVDDYYEDYQYSVGNSEIARQFMQTLAKQLKLAYYPEENDRKVLEIGSSDGEQLVAFKDTGCRVLGYEPSSTLCELATNKGVQSIQGLFTAESVKNLPDDFREVDIVMLSYTFDHLPDPRSFLAAARSILNKRDGILVVEVHNLEKIVERQEYCLFEHEHSIYLTETTASQICRMEGFEVIDFDLVPERNRRANSLIFVATLKESYLARQAVEPRTPSNFSNINFYDRIGFGIRQGIANLEKYVESVTGQGKKLAGYGGGGRGVMTLAAMNNANKISYLVDKKPKRPGLLVPKTGIPLVGIDYLLSDPVDKILVFSFGYMQEIQAEIGAIGYQPYQFISLLDVLAGKF